MFSHSGFSDTDANGITMKNLLSAFDPDAKAQFYCDVQPPDFSAASDHFRVTDIQMIKACLGKRSRHVFSSQEEKTQQCAPADHTKSNARKIPAGLKKYKYNFCLKWLREWLWQVSPWGHRQLDQWIAEVDPDAIVYMVGESLFMDKLVLKTCKETGKPLILYNGEAFRIIDLSTRHGLERAYYKRTQTLYRRLNQQAELVIYNCRMLQEDYQAFYPPKAKTMIAYNSADRVCADYQCREVNPVITYFGNLGVGRSDSLLQVADVLQSISDSLVLDIYGNATAENQTRFEAHPAVHYHGFVNATQLRQIIEGSDILLHVESFDEGIIPKLKYAFSTKIAQCMRSGRCFVSYAPSGSASSQYLAALDGPVLISDGEQLPILLRQLIENPLLRQEKAHKTLLVGEQNHNMQKTAKLVRLQIEKTAH